ncbi:MAG: mechanosensitive ion channel family protein [Candidatus Krumholzibacteriia bacterium]
MNLPFEVPQFLQPYLGDARIRALVLFVLFLGFAKLTDLFLCSLLARLARRTDTEVDDRTIALLHRPIFYSVLLVGVHFAAQSLAAPDPAPTWIRVLLKTLAIGIWTVTSMRLITSLLRWFGGRRQTGVLQVRTLPLFVNIAKLVILGGATYLVFLVWEINVSAWLASAGIVGIAVGFAAKDTIANLFAGIFIITDAPYRVGDYVVLDSGERGRVTDIGLRSTRLLTRDDIEVTIPNSIMGNTKIVNESGGPKEHERIRVSVGVAYGSDIDRVREILMEVASTSSLVSASPEPRVRFRTFGDSGLNFELLCWIDLPELRGRVLDTLNTEVYKRFAADNIEIPFPKRDVYVRQLPNAAADA